MAFDEEREVVVLVGGCTEWQCDELLAQTWEWNGESWALAQTSVQPDGRMLVAMAYDPVDARLLMFGGCVGAGCRDAHGVTDELWAYDGTDWSPVAVDDPEGDGSPPPIVGHTMIYDDARDQSNGPSG